MMNINFEVTMEYRAKEEMKAEEKIRELEGQGYFLKRRDIEYDQGFGQGNYKVEVTMEKNEQN